MVDRSDLEKKIFSEIDVRQRDINRAIHRLYGIMQGIAADYKIKDEEISGLRGWINIHEFLHHMEPFKSTISLIEKCLEDGLIDEDEREEILEWCCRFSDEFSLPETMTDAIRRLHGVLHGISIDSKIDQMEVLGLKDWLHDYDVFRDHWPFCETWKIITQILDDGVVTKEEQIFLLEFCKYFSEKTLSDTKIHDEIYQETFMQSYFPIFKPFSELCDNDIEIIFVENKFCFTGPARFGSRKKLHEVVSSLGGWPVKNVTSDLNYLVIGAQSSPCWAYSTYGRKIEAVIEYRKKGYQMFILHEDVFLAQANRLHAD